MDYKDYKLTDDYLYLKNELEKLPLKIIIDKNPYNNSYIDCNYKDTFDIHKLIAHLDIVSQVDNELDSYRWLKIAHWAAYFSHYDVFVAMLKIRSDYSLYTSYMLLFAIYVGGDEFCTKVLNFIEEMYEDRSDINKPKVLLLQNFPNLSKNKKNDKCFAIMKSKLFSPWLYDNKYIFDEEIIKNIKVFYRIYREFYFNRAWVKTEVHKKFNDILNPLDLSIDILE